MKITYSLEKRKSAKGTEYWSLIIKLDGKEIEQVMVSRPVQALCELPNIEIE
jgi:hypothetical protein